MGGYFYNNLISTFQILANWILQIFPENPVFSMIPEVNYVKTLEIVIINYTPYVLDHGMLPCPTFAKETPSLMVDFSL